MVKVLFVCLGNICRSPSAEGIFRRIVQEAGLSDSFLIDSAGMIDYHQGEAPDRRAQATAQAKGIDLSQLEARQYRYEDFEEFDYILVMDKQNLEDIQKVCPNEYLEKIQLMCNFTVDFDETEVPDPYFGGPFGFESVFALLEDSSKGLLHEIRGSNLDSNG
jgi:protein-tyrosine phosphatase